MQPNNSVLLTGNLTRDPELRHTQTGKAVTSFTIAVNERYGDKETTTFVDCETWAGTAEFVAKHFKKGNALQLLGSLKQDNWEDKTTGQKRSKLLVNAARIGFVPKSGGAVATEASEDDASGDDASGDEEAPAPSAKPKGKGGKKAVTTEDIAF